MSLELVFSLDCGLVFSVNEKVDSSLYLSTNSRQNCKSTYQICKTANEAMMRYSNNVPKNLKERICIYVLANLDHNTIYPIFFEPQHDEAHKYFFIKYVVNEFIHLKCIYDARKRTQTFHKQYYRHSLLKNIHQYGQ